MGNLSRSLETFNQMIYGKSMVRVRSLTPVISKDRRLWDQKYKMFINEYSVMDISSAFPRCIKITVVTLAFKSRSSQIPQTAVLTIPTASRTVHKEDYLMARYIMKSGINGVLW
jgi:hypothetical protein